MKNKLLITALAAIIASAATITIHAASSTKDEQENMFKELVDLSKKQLELYACLRLLERTPGGLRTDTVKIIDGELVNDDNKINNLNRQLKAAGYEQDQIDYVVRESLPNLISTEYGNFINTLILSDELPEDLETLIKNMLLSILRKR